MAQHGLHNGPKTPSRASKTSPRASKTSPRDFKTLPRPSKLIPSICKMHPTGFHTPPRVFLVDFPPQTHQSNRKSQTTAAASAAFHKIPLRKSYVFRSFGVLTLLLVAGPTCVRVSLHSGTEKLPKSHQERPKTQTLRRGAKLPPIRLQEHPRRPKHPRTLSRVHQETSIRLHDAFVSVRNTLEIVPARSAHGAVERRPIAPLQEHLSFQRSAEAPPRRTQHNVPRTRIVRQGTISSTTARQVLARFQHARTMFASNVESNGLLRKRWPCNKDGLAAIRPRGRLPSA